MEVFSSTQLIVQPSITNTSFACMVERLVQWYPMAFGILIPHDSKVALMRMQTGLSWSPRFCSELYCELTKSYQMPATDITKWWVRLHDVSLGELHERLWHEANMTDMAYYRDS